ncbi:alpha/beta hydrolase fold domain-containing protein [Nonomuraea sp. NPDC003707]
MVFAHGGAFVIGDLETHDRTCRRIAHACDVEVLAIDYRRAPEHPYPAVRRGRDRGAALGPPGRGGRRQRRRPPGHHGLPAAA